MRICFLVHNLRQDNGAGVFSRRLIAELGMSLGAETTVLTSVSAGEANELPLLAGGKRRIIRNLRAIRAAIRQCNVVHALDVFPYGIIAAVAGLGLGKPLIITAVGSGSILPLYHRWYGPLSRMVYRRATAITAISTFTRDEILKQMPGLNIAVINPGVDVEEFAENSSIQNTEYKMQRYTPYVLSVGQLRWRKGYHASIQAFAKVSKRFPDLHYVIVGKRYTDVYERRLKNLIAELGLSGRVHILQDVGTRQELADIYRGAGLFCLFSQNVKHDIEGFGLVFLEAAAAGLPVVGSKNCGIDDAVEDGKNGILVPTRDSDDFADAIMRILGDEEMKKKMSVASRTWAVRSVWERRMGGYVRIYKNLPLAGK